MNIVETLIGLLIENMFLVVLIVGGIISFLKRLNPQPEERPKTRTQTAPQNTNQPIEDMNRHSEVEMKRPEMGGQTIEEIFNNKGLGKKETPQIEPVRVQTKPKVKTTTELSIHNVSRKQIIDGVIWSEILGPPKSRQKNGRLGR